MSDLTIGIYNHETGETVVREMTEEEIAIYEVSKAESLARKEAEMAKKSARESALAKLFDLGLTEEEIAAL